MNKTEKDVISVFAQFGSVKVLRRGRLSVKKNFTGEYLDSVNNRRTIAEGNQNFGKQHFWKRCEGKDLYPKIGYLSLSGSKESLLKQVCAKLYYFTTNAAPLRTEIDIFGATVQKVGKTYFLSCHFSMVIRD